MITLLWFSEGSDCFHGLVGEAVSPYVLYVLSLQHSREKFHYYKYYLTKH